MKKFLVLISMILWVVVAFGQDSPTPTETNTPVDTATPTVTETPTETPVPTDTPTITSTPTFTRTPTPTATITLTPTKTPTSTTTNTPTAADGCSTPVVITPAVCYSNTTSGYKNDYYPGCYPAPFYNGPDHCYEFTLTTNAVVTFIGVAEYDADWSIASACSATSYKYCIPESETHATPTCNPVTTPHPRGWLYDSETLSAGTYYLWVDGSSGQSGVYSFSVNWTVGTSTPTVAATSTPTETAVPSTATPTRTSTRTSTPTITNTPTETPTITSTPTVTVTPGCIVKGCQATGTVGTVSTYLVASYDRLGTRVFNSGNETIWLGLGEAAVVGKGIGVASGTAWESTGDDRWTGTIYGISTGGSDTVGIRTW